MSDTTTPSAAEVMGWTYTNHLPPHVFEDTGVRRTCAWCDTLEDGAPPGCLENPVLPQPTPDDMLAWLHDPENERHGWSVINCTPEPGGLWGVYFHPWAGEYYESEVAPTLHAALEQAVIAVGRVGLEPTT